MTWNNWGFIRAIFSPLYPIVKGSMVSHSQKVAIRKGPWETNTWELCHLLSRWYKWLQLVRPVVPPNNPPCGRYFWNPSFRPHFCWSPPKTKDPLLFTLTWPSCGAPCNKDFDKNTLGKNGPAKGRSVIFLHLFFEVMDYGFLSWDENQHFSPPAFGKNMIGTCSFRIQLAQSQAWWRSKG